MKKVLTSLLGQNLAYERLVKFLKPWTLYLVSVFENDVDKKVYRTIMFNPEKGFRYTQAQHTR